MIWLNDLKYVKVSRIEDKGNYVKATLSTSEKKQDGSYEWSNWNAAFLGKSLDKAKQLKDGDKITVVKGKLTNVYNKETKKSYTNMTVFEFSRVETYDEKPSDDFSFASSDDDLPWT